MADHQGPDAPLTISPDVEKARPLRRAHPLVAVPGVVGGAERPEVERDHPGGVGSVHHRVHAAGGQLVHQSLDRQDETRRARHVVEQGEPRPCAHSAEDGLEHLLGGPPAETAPAPPRRAPPRARRRRLPRSGRRCRRGPSPGSRRPGRARASGGPCSPRWWRSGRRRGRPARPRRRRRGRPGRRRGGPPAPGSGTARALARAAPGGAPGRPARPGGRPRRSRGSGRSRRGRAARGRASRSTVEPGWSRLVILGQAGAPVNGRQVPGPGPPGGGTPGRRSAFPGREHRPTRRGWRRPAAIRREVTSPCGGWEADGRMAPPRRSRTALDGVVSNQLSEDRNLWVNPSAPKEVPHE